MQKTEKIYRELQKHLNRQPVGYPATRSGADIRLLQRLFSPDEARLALHLRHTPSSLRDIHARVKQNGMSFDDMEVMLEHLATNGVIGHSEKDGIDHYCIIPLVVGMYEGQLNRLTSDFLADFDEYSSSRAFNLELLSTELPQMRTIPVEESITPEHHVGTYDQLTNLILGTDGPIAVFECICRKAQQVRGKTCKATSRMETCMAVSDIARNNIRAGAGREVSKEEALDFARRNESEALILQPSNSQDIEFICGCC